MSPEHCAACGMDIDTQDAHKASWGPVTLYLHPDDCEYVYRDSGAPRLRDAVVTALRRWQRQLRPQGFQRSTTDREP